MGYAVELYFDGETEDRVTRLWDTFAERGITSLLPSIGSRPHISLAVFDKIDPEQLTDVLIDIAHETPAFEVDLAAVGSFPGQEGVLFLVPTVSTELIRLHEYFHNRLHSMGIECNPYYRPGNWVPHCTVASDLPDSLIEAGFDIARKSAVFGRAQVNSVGLVSFRPVREISNHPFRGLDAV